MSPFAQFWATLTKLGNKIYNIVILYQMILFSVFKLKGQRHDLWSFQVILIKNTIVINNTQIQFHSCIHISNKNNNIVWKFRTPRSKVKVTRSHLKANRHQIFFILPLKRCLKITKNALNRNIQIFIFLKLSTIYECRVYLARLVFSPFLMVVIL